VKHVKNQIFAVLFFCILVITFACIKQSTSNTTEISSGKINAKSNSAHSTIIVQIQSNKQAEPLLQKNLTVNPRIVEAALLTRSQILSRTDISRFQVLQTISSVSKAALLEANIALSESKIVSKNSETMPLSSEAVSSESETIPSESETVSSKSETVPSGSEAVTSGSGTEPSITVVESEIALDSSTSTAVIESEIALDSLTSTAVISETAITPETTGTPIIAPPSATVEQAQKWAESRGATQVFISLAPLFWELSKTSGVDPAVAYAQSAKETAFGRYTGVLDSSFHNTCGLKTTQGGDNYDPGAHMRFADWYTGITAHLDHLALYAGALGYPKTGTPDPRHFAYLSGRAGTVEELGGKWAPSTDYGVSLVRDYLAVLRNMQ